MNDSDDLKFTCQACGREFEPETEAMVEVGFSRELFRQGDPLPEDMITPEQLAAMSEYELQEIGLTLEDREKLMRGEPVDTGAVCLCEACREEIFEEE